MAQNNDELNQRQQRREELRKKRETEQRRMKVALIAAAVVIGACAVGLIALIRGSGAKTAAETTLPVQTTTAPTETKQSWAEQTATSTIHIRAAGDLNITDSVVSAGLAASGYNFTRAFIDVMPLLAEADLTVLNLEGNICGEPYGTARTSAPPELLDALRNAGVDLLQMANSCAINNGLIGLRSTLQAIHNAGMEPVGAFATPDDFQRSKGYTICEAQGIKIAFVAFTKGMNGMGLPSGSEDCVNLLYTDYDTTYKDVDTNGITRILKNVQAEKPDVTIALVHWGSEGTDTISDTQERIVKLMQKNGVDVIIGNHPHRVHKIDFNQATGTLVAYSLGDFFGDAEAAGSNYSIILDIEITKDNHAGTTRVTNFSYTPIYTLKETDCIDGDRRVVRIHEAMYAYNFNFVDKITAACNADMAYSLGRIEARVTGIEPTAPAETTETTVETAEATEETVAETTAAATATTAATTEATEESG